jgi:phosphonatase-like hydrolase
LQTSATGSKKLKRMIGMVVFDMAGTTVDEDNVVYKTLQRALEDNGQYFTLDQVLAEGAGKEKAQAIKSILKIRKIQNDHLTGQIYEHFLILLNEAYRYLDVKPMPGVKDLFHLLKQKKIAVILNTGYNTDTAYSLIEKLGWEKGVDYDALVTATDVKESRPNPDMIFLAMEKCKVKNAAEVIKVGDSIIDIEEGRNAGCGLSIGITTGAHSRQQLSTANPDFIISSLSELPKIIETFDNQSK